MAASSRCFAGSASRFPGARSSPSSVRTVRARPRLRAISGLLPYQNGKRSSAVRSHFDGAETTGTDTAALVRGGMAQVMEGRRIFAEISVDDNFKTGAHTRKDKAGVVESYERVMDLFPRLRERHKQVAGCMSGGGYYTEAAKAYGERRTAPSCTARSTARRWPRPLSVVFQVASRPVTTVTTEIGERE